MNEYMRSMRHCRRPFDDDGHAEKHAHVERARGWKALSQVVIMLRQPKIPNTCRALREMV